VHGVLVAKAPAVQLDHIPTGHASPAVVRISLQDERGQPSLRQMERGRQAGEPGTDDDYLRVRITLVLSRHIAAPQAVKRKT
jgi:hypothetical protein